MLLRYRTCDCGTPLKSALARMANHRDSIFSGAKDLVKQLFTIFAAQASPSRAFISLCA